MRLRDNPVFRYGLRRRGKTVAIVWSSMVVAILGATYVILIVIDAPMQDAVDIYLPVLIAVLCVGPFFWAPALAPSMLAREFDNRTYDALRLTLMTPDDIGFGYMCALAVPMVMGVASSIPVTILAVGGFDLNLGHVILGYVAGCITIISVLSFSLWMAAAIRRTSNATVITYFAVFVALVLGLCTIASACSGGPPRDLSATVFCLWTIPAVFGALISWAGMLSALRRIEGMDERSDAFRAHPPPGAPSERQTLEEIKSDGFARF